MTNEYDHLFQSAAEKYLPGVEDAWLRLKAQAIQESGLNPSAVSPCGAEGIAQFMPQTWAEWGEKGKPAFDPEAAITAQARMMAWLMGIPVDGHGRYSGFSHVKMGEKVWRFALGAYNAGCGNIQKAMQEACRQKRDPRVWEEVSAVLYAITKAHAKETQDYVVRILGHLSALKQKGV